jgi:RHS repeat-associated protein
MDGRSEQDSAYRYGFNGKELDGGGEWGGQNNYDYGFRIYNPSIAKFLSVDPLTKEYPWYTPYQFAGNKPIWAIDLDGLEEFVYQYKISGENSVTLIQKYSNVKVVPLGGGWGAAQFKRIDIRTGEPFNPNELGAIQYQYFDDEGNRLQIRRNLEGDLVKGDNEFIDGHTRNYFSSIYIGNINPTTKEGLADYRREPQDLMDAAALQHDKDYDAVDAAGIKGALFDSQTLPADVRLVIKAQSVINKAKNKEIDPYTDKPISKSTVQRAKAVKSAFSTIIDVKSSMATQNNDENQQ